MIVNFVVGAALVIAMVDVPLFVNAVEIDLERSAVIAGWILSAMTAAMALMSYVGGRVTERTWYGPPILVGLVAATLAYTLMGLTWGGDTPYPVLAVQLALLGGGIGLTVAPTTSAVVDHAEPDSRGAAAAVVMVVRMIGLSVGLSALTAWGLARFNALRSEIDLPPITDPEFQSALNAATERLTAQSIADTFLASAVALGIGLALCLALLRRSSSDAPDPLAPLEALMTTESDTPESDTPDPDAPRRRIRWPETEDTEAGHRHAGHRGRHRSRRIDRRRHQRTRHVRGDPLVGRHRRDAGRGGRRDRPRRRPAPDPRSPRPSAG